MSNGDKVLGYWEIRCKGFTGPCPTLGACAALPRHENGETPDQALTRALGYGNPDLDCGPHRAIPVDYPPKGYMTEAELREYLGI